MAITKSRSDRHAFRDGWFYTDDFGYFLRRAICFVSGRKKDMLKSGGIIIYAAGDREHILEAAVIGVPDTQWARP